MENIKTSLQGEPENEMNLLYKAPTFKLAVILLEICFPFSCIFLRFLCFLYSRFCLIYYSKKFFFFLLFLSFPFPLINVQLICMMARNNIFLWLNIPATGQTMKMIPSTRRSECGWRRTFPASKLFSKTINFLYHHQTLMYFKLHTNFSSRSGNFSSWHP